MSLSTGKPRSVTTPGFATDIRSSHEITAQVSSINLLPEQNSGSEYAHQNNGDTVQYQEHASIGPYQQVYYATALDRLSEGLSENLASGLTSGHSDDAEFSNAQDIDSSSFGRPLRRFYSRTIVGVLGPIIILSYVIIVWRVYLAPLQPDSTVAFGPPGAKWVFYSWFVAGVIGLSLSLYGLAGAEAGMLMERTWKVEDAMRLMLHADNTWSGPGGWMKALKWVVQTRRVRSQQTKLPSRLWFVLALPSLVVFVAWPLSGLCLEMTSGFLHGKPGQGTNVTGFIRSNFNANPGGRRPSRGSYIGARVLEHGAVYTSEGFDRSQSEFLQKVPVVLPSTEGVQEMFLTAQGETPIESNAWGLLLHYDCRVVDKLSDFYLLKDRRSSTNVFGSKRIMFGFAPVESSRTVDDDFPANGLTSESTPTPSLVPSTDLNSSCQECVAFDYTKQVKYASYRLHDNTTIVEVAKEPRSGRADGAIGDNLKWSLNMDAVIETAYQSWQPQTASENEPPCGWLNEAKNPSTSYCYHDLQENASEPYPGIDKKRVFEVLLWQRLEFLPGAPLAQTILNNPIIRSIESLYGEYVDTGNRNLTAIGASCTSSSSVGSANIDGVRSTYSNFQRTDTPIPVRKDDCAKRFGAETLACTLAINRDGWLKWLFDSIGLPVPLDTSAEGDESHIYGNLRFNTQLEYLQADQLRQVLLQAYSTYAIKLMYNEGRDFIGANMTRLKSRVPDLTAFVAGTVIEPGVMPAAVPVALFGLWALISSGLCLVYGFRRRWSAILDGHTVFRLGAELQQTYRARLQRYSTIAEIEECEALHEIPGYVADMEPNGDVGRIGLMDGKPARKNKLYR